MTPGSLAEHPFKIVSPVILALNLIFRTRRNALKISKTVYFMMVIDPLFWYTT